MKTLTSYFSFLISKKIILIYSDEGKIFTSNKLISKLLKFLRKKKPIDQI